MEPFTIAPSVAPQVPQQSAAKISRPKVYHRVLVVFLSSLIIAVAFTLNFPNTATAAEPSTTKATIEGRVRELIPDIEAYITSGMKRFDVPGLAIGIVADNRLIYAKGFGVRSKSNGLPVAVKQFAKPANPRPFPPLAPLTGNFVNSSLGKAALTLKDDALVIEVHATGAKFKLVPWDGDIFMATLLATDQFGPIVDLDYMTKGFAQFQMDKDGKLNLLRLSTRDGQAYEFRRE